MIPLRNSLRFLFNENVDPMVKIKTIEKSAAAEKAEECMRPLNSVNQQVNVVHFQRNPQNGISKRCLPDYPGIVFAFRTWDVRNRHIAIQKNKMAVKKYKQAIKKLKRAVRNNEKAIKNLDEAATKNKKAIKKI